MKNKTVQKFISSLLIIFILTPAIFLSFQAKQAEAQFIVNDPIHTVVTVKIVVVEVLKQMLMAVVRKLLNQMTQNTINWINNGFHGNPLYLENPESFFKDIAKFEVKRLVNLFGYDSLRYPFGKDFGLNIINSYQRQLEDNAAYSLSKVINDPALLDSYRNDFNVGGWNGFLINTQYPQNNYIGFQMVATEELARRLQGTVQNNAQKVQTTLQQGMGFLSPQACPTSINPNYNNLQNAFQKPTAPTVWQGPCNDQACLDQQAASQKAYDDWAKINTCLKADGTSGLVNTTPGSVVGSQIGIALGSKIKQAELGAALGNSLSAIFDALLNKFINKGLSALTDTNYQGEGGSGDGFITAYNSIEGKEAADGFLGATNTAADTYAGTIASGGGGGQCDESGNQYSGALGDAESAVLAANPAVGDLPNIESGGRQNARTFLKLVETELISKGFNATVDVKNGNGNPSTGDIIGIWKSGDAMMERYDAIIGAASTIREAATAQFAGFIPLDCTASGGNKDCGCKTTETTPPITECNPPKVIENNICVDPTTTGADSAKIDSINPVLALAGSAITIAGSNLTNQVSFYDGSGARNTVVGTVNDTKTQTIVTVPASLPSGNATVKIYQGNQVWSNGMLIAVINTLGGGGATPTEPSFDATGGWGGNLAFNPNNNTWLVVSGGVNGRIMGNDGTLITPEFTINSSASGGPKAVFAPDINKYLVVWADWDNPDRTTVSAILGRFINPDGTFSGNKFVIYNDVNYPSQASWPPSSSGLRYDSRNKKFVLVWENRHPVVDSYMITISQSGVPGSVIDVGTDTGVGSWAPVLAVNEDLNEYCIAYTKGNGTTSVVKKYNVATGVLGPETTLDDNNFGVSGIVYNSVNKKYLIARPAKSSFVTNGKILNSCNITDGGNIFTINSAGSGGSLSYNPKSNSYASIVQNQNDFGNTYTILSSTGAKIKQGVAFAGSRNGKGGNFAPVIAPNLNNGTFSATSSIDYAITRFASNLGPVTSGGGTSSGGTTGGVITTIALPAPNHSMTLGYYYAVGHYGNFLSEVSSYTNSQIVVAGSWVRDATQRQDGSWDTTSCLRDIAGMNSAFSAVAAANQNIIYIPVAPGATHCPDGQPEYDIAMSVARNYWNNIDILYIADEPNWNQATTQNNITAFENAVVGSNLSSKPIMINYTLNQIMTGTSYLANNIDIVSFEAYADSARQNEANLAVNLLSEVNQAKARIGNRQTMLVAQGYGRNYCPAGSSTLCWSNLTSLQSIQTVPYLAGYNDPNVIGITIFSYGRLSGTKDLVTNHNGQCIKTEHQRIWGAISGTTQPSSVSCSGVTANTPSTTTPPSVVANVDLGVGSFPDVVWYNNRLYVAYRSGDYSTINLYSFDKNLGDKKTEKIFPLNPGAGGFPRLTVSSNTLWLAFRDGTASGEDIKLWRQDTGAIESLGPGVGNNPVALGNGYIAWQKCEGTNCANSKVYRRLLTGGTSTFIQNWLPTGISRILSNGSVIMIDTDRYAVSWGLDAWFAGPLTIAAAFEDFDGAIGRFNNNPATQFSLWGGGVGVGQRSFNPHAATDGNGNYAVTAWGNGTNVRVAVLK